MFRLTQEETTNFREVEVKTEIKSNLRESVNVIAQKVQLLFPQNQYQWDVPAGTQGA